MRRSLVRSSFFICAVALLASACTSNQPSVTPTPSASSPTPTLSPSIVPTVTQSPTPVRTPAPAATHVVYEDDGIWLYRVASNTQRLIVPNAGGVAARQPMFKSATHISYIAQGTNSSRVVSFPRTNPDAKTTDLTVPQSTGRLLLYGWSPDARTLGYLVDTDDTTGTKLFLRKQGQAARLVRTWDVQYARDGIADDDTRLEWSPDGRRILLIFTPFGPGENADTMFVMDRNGNELVPARSGTFGRWSLDSKTVYYREFEAPTKRWYALRPSDGSQRLLRMKTGSRHAMLSPNGKQIAYDTGVSDAPLYVYDIATATERKVGRKGLSPVWLTVGTLAYTRVRACYSIECEAGPWASNGSTRKLVVATGAVSTLPITETGISLDVLYSTT